MHIKIVPFGLVCVNILDYPLYLLHFCWCINYQVCLSTKILYIGKYINDAIYISVTKWMAIINIVKAKLKVGLSPFKQNFLYLLQ